MFGILTKNLKYHSFKIVSSFKKFSRPTAKMTEVLRIKYMYSKSILMCMEGRKTHNSNSIFLFYYYILILILIFLFCYFILINSYSCILILNYCIIISILSFKIPILIF